jgi:hypothetical protein
VATHFPEPKKRAHEAQAHLQTAAAARPRERGANVVQLAVYPVEPDRLLPTRQVRFGLLAHGQEVGSVPRAELLSFSGRLELLDTVLAHGLEHAEAWLAARLAYPLHQAAVDEWLQIVEHLTGGQGGVVTHGLGSFQRPPPDEHGKPTKQRLVSRSEQLVAPGQSVAQRLLAFRQVGGPNRQNWQAPFEPPQQHVGLQQPRARGGQLDRKWHAVQVPADRRGRHYVRRVEREIRRRRQSPFGKQAHRGRSGRRGDVQYFARRLCGRCRERGHRETLFAKDAQRCPAGNKQREARAPLEEFGQERRGAEQVLEVVQHEQDLAVAQVIEQHLAWGALAG